MFAPVNYTPLAMLWDQFIEARRMEFSKHLVKSFRKDGFNPVFLRGGPLDIAEHVFLREMNNRGIFVAHSDGRVFRLYSNFRDEVQGLFTQIGPYSSRWAAAAAFVERGNDEEVRRIAGSSFAAWEHEANEGDAWLEHYEMFVDFADSGLANLKRELRYHSLPVCYERRRFLIVEELPFWTRRSENADDQEQIVKHFGGWSLCVANDTINDWDTFVVHGDLSLTGSETSPEETTTPIGRPAKVPRVAEIYKTLYPNGHNCAWKRVALEIGDVLGESVSLQTVKRAVETIKNPNA